MYPIAGNYIASQHVAVQSFVGIFAENWVTTGYIGYIIMWSDHGALHFPQSLALTLGNDVMQCHCWLEDPQIGYE